MNPVRKAARETRQHIARGGTYTLQEAVARCVSMADALKAFDSTHDDEGGTAVLCCGAPANITAGLFGAKVECPRCHAKAVDATSPMFSPLLERGDSYITIPSDEWLSQFGDKTWLVMHEGDRP